MWNSSGAGTRPRAISSFSPHETVPTAASIITADILTAIYQVPVRVQEHRSERPAEPKPEPQKPPRRRSRLVPVGRGVETVPTEHAGRVGGEPRAGALGPLAVVGLGLEPVDVAEVVQPGRGRLADVAADDLHPRGRLVRGPDLVVEFGVRGERLRGARLRGGGVDISVEKLRNGNNDMVLTRGHFARYMIDHGYSKDKADAFKHYLGVDTPYFVKRRYLSPEECVRLILDCGGTPVLAHPIIYNLPAAELEALVAKLVVPIRSQ